MSSTDSLASRVRLKHCAAELQRTGANCRASSTTAGAIPASSAASSGSSGQAFPPAAPALATCSCSHRHGSAASSADHTRSHGSFPSNSGW